MMSPTSRALFDLRADQCRWPIEPQHDDRARSACCGARGRRPVRRGRAHEGRTSGLASCLRRGMGGRGVFRPYETDDQPARAFLLLSVPKKSFSLRPNQNSDALAQGKAMPVVRGLSAVRNPPYGFCPLGLAGTQSGQHAGSFQSPARCHFSSVSSRC
jgi:hypothetical protein